MNKNKLDSYYRIALAVSEDSPDKQTKVGSLLIHGETGAVIGSGYNGFIRGGPDEILPKTRPDKYKYIIHSEINTLLNCARHGISTDKCFIFCTLSPCISCLRSIWQCGICVIYFKDMYRDFSENHKMKDLQIDLSETNSYYRIELTPKEV